MDVLQPRLFDLRLRGSLPGRRVAPIPWRRLAEFMLPSAWFLLVANG